MKKSEKIQKVGIGDGREIAIITKYPRWMKLFMKFIEVFVIPDIKDYEMICDIKIPSKKDFINPKINLNDISEIA